MSTRENRRALRVTLHVPTVVEGVDQPEVDLHENLARVYQRVVPAAAVVGKKFPGTVRDLSTNGAFVAGVAMPLLSRVCFSFHLEGYGPIEAIGWTMWRRDQDCEIPRADGTTALLPMGFGVLFEAIPIDARLRIHELVTHPATL